MAPDQMVRGTTNRQGSPEQSHAGSRVRLHDRTARLISPAGSVLLDEAVHRARRIQLVGWAHLSASRLVRELFPMFGTVLSGP
ncbi:hypothetical protein SUDANB43_00063 [Streptomyces sp. enrichment culture]